MHIASASAMLPTGAWSHKQSEYRFVSLQRYTDHEGGVHAAPAMTCVSSSTVVALHAMPTRKSVQGTTEERSVIHYICV